MAIKARVPKSAQIPAGEHRPAFWQYAQRATKAAKHRAKRIGVPFEIDEYFIDRLFVDQRWRCAVSGVPLEPPTSTIRDLRKFARDPFSPSIDRIIPKLGYVPGNVRIVSNIVNMAMNEWGLDNLLTMVRHMAQIGRH